MIFSEEMQINSVILPDPLLASRERGALILPDINEITLPEGGFQLNGPSDFDVDALSAALLLFDRLDYPSNNAIKVGPDQPPGLDGWPGWQRSRVQVSGKIASGIFSQSLIASFDALNEREEGRWALARGAAQQSFPPNLMGKDLAFSVKLQNALPIPDRSMPYDDVLSFKEPRRAELQALRHHIEELGLEVALNGHSKIAETITFEKFDQALADYAKVSREGNFLKRLCSLDVKFKWDEAIFRSLGLAGAGLSMAIPATTTVWHALAAAVPMIGIESALGLKGKRGRGGPFEYIFKAGREL